MILLSSRSCDWVRFRGFLLSGSLWQVPRFFLRTDKQLPVVQELSGALLLGCNNRLVAVGRLAIVISRL